jgi:uncharacterized membrane protein YcgQ (UPF0703/DUF1980 family)
MTSLGIEPVTFWYVYLMEKNIKTQIATFSSLRYNIFMYFILSLLFLYLVFRRNAFQSRYGPRVDSASNRNEYLESSCGVKRDRCIRLIT